MIELKNFSDKKRAALLRKAVLLFFLAGIALSFNLWISERNFPMAPVFSSITFLKFPVDYILLFLLLLALGINFFRWKNSINLFAIGILFVLLLQDQNRWHPWVYIYFLFLIIFSLPQKAGSSPLLYFRIIIIGVYTWSGIHKLNVHFIDSTVHSILTEFVGMSNEQTITNYKSLGYLIPVIELGIAAFLWFPKRRNLAVYLVAVAHIFIMLYLSPLGIDTNFVVYPWNLAMIIIVFLVFYNTTDKIELKLSIKKDRKILAFILLTWIMPGLNFLGLWDHYLSFSLYSGKSNGYFIAIAEGQLSKLDKDLSPYYMPVKNMQGGRIISVNRWAVGEMNIPFNPETRIFKKIAKEFCELGIEEDQISFLEIKPPFNKGIVIRYTCKDLEK
jgi:hypothetical protein